MLEGKVIIITGGAGLLGIEFAKIILTNNGIVILADVDVVSANKGVQKLKLLTRNENVDFVKLDITSKLSISRIIDIVVQKYKRIDAWVNNAYPQTSRTRENTKREYSSSFFDMNYIDFCESISLNIGGVFLCSQIISTYFIQQGYGNIINVSSIYGVIAPRFEIYNNTKMTMPVDYAVNKSAIIQFTKYLSKYLKNKNIRVNSLSPGGVYNKQPESFVKKYRDHSLNKGMLDKEDIAGSLLYLISDHSKYVNGQNIIVDDGWTL
jgi:NAD(P)-dependent dehydrogenase (short-subunit alcohol dehydrogenase family)